MSSKRHSILPPVSSAGPKPPVHFSSSITIADSALLSGAYLIDIHSESVIHPRAKLDSHLGRVSISRRCVVHERAHLGAAPAAGAPAPPRSGGGEGAGEGTGGQVMAVTLGEYVVVEVGATVEGGETRIGEGTTVGVGARVGAGAVIGNVSFYFQLRGARRILGHKLMPSLIALHPDTTYRDFPR